MRRAPPAVRLAAHGRPRPRLDPIRCGLRTALVRLGGRTKKGGRRVEPPRAVRPALGRRRGEPALRRGVVVCVLVGWAIYHSNTPVVHTNRRLVTTLSTNII